MHVQLRRGAGDQDAAVAVHVDLRGGGSALRRGQRRRGHCGGRRRRRRRTKPVTAVEALEERLEYDEVSSILAGEAQLQLLLQRIFLAQRLEHSDLRVSLRLGKDRCEALRRLFRARLLRCWRLGRWRRRGREHPRYLIAAGALACPRSGRVHLGQAEHAAEHAKCFKMLIYEGASQNR